MPALPFSTGGTVPSTARWLTVEKLRIPEDGCSAYRIGVTLPDGASFYEQVRIPDHLVATSPDPDEFLSRAMRQAVRQISSRFAEILTNALQSIKEQYGDYDNTAPRVTDNAGGLGAAVDAYLSAVNARAISPLDVFMPPVPRIPPIPNILNLRQLYGISTVRPSYPSYPAFTEPAPSRQHIKDKAMAILAQRIGWRKMRQLKKKGYFEEYGKAGTFRFHLTKSGGVTLLQEHRFGNKTRIVEWDLCIQSLVPNMPPGDVILSRWLEFRADEAKFLETANFRNIRTKDEAMEPSTNRITYSSALREFMATGRIFIHTSGD